MIEIKQSTAAELPFLLVDADGAPVTGATPTVTLRQPGETFEAATNSAVEDAAGHYHIITTTLETNTLPFLILHAEAAGAKNADMLFSVVANVESDSIAAIGALTTPPTVAAIADAVWDEAMVGHATAGTAGAQLTAAGASGDPWASVVPAAYADGTAGAAIGRLNNTPAEAPVIVVPAPDEDASLTVVYAYTESITNEKRAGIVLTFKLVTVPAKSERLLEVAAQTATTDADGYAQISLQSDLRYRVTCRDLGLEKTFTATGETFNLLTLIP